MSPDGLDHFQKEQIEILQKVEFNHIGLNRFSLEFINPKTRDQSFEKRLLVQVK